MIGLQLYSTLHSISGRFCMVTGQVRLVGQFCPMTLRDPSISHFSYSVVGSLSDSRVSMFRRLVASVTRLHVRGAPLGALIPALALVASPRRLHACRLGRGRDVRRFPEECVEAVHARLWAHGQYACDSPLCRPSPLSRLPDVRGLMMSRWLPASRSRADHRQQGEPEVFQAVLHQGDVRREPPLCARGH